MKKFYWLDLIRFLSAFVVLVAHARGFIFVNYNSLDEFSKNSASFLFYMFTKMSIEPVIVFIVLSGYLIGNKLINEVRRGKFRLSSYLRDRALRIYIPLVPALLLTTFCALYVGKDISVFSFFGNLLQLQGVLVENYGMNSPLWSLAYEFWFYVLAGVFVIILKNNKLAYLLVFLVVLFVFLKLEVVYLYCWLAGALASTLDLAKDRFRIFVISLLLSVTLVLLIQLTKDSNFLKNLSHLDFQSLNVYFQFAFGCSVGLFLHCVSSMQPKKAYMQGIEKLGTSLATFSYTLYLTHYPILYVISYLLGSKFSVINFSSVMVFFFALGTCIVTSLVFYYLFERNTNKVKLYMQGK